MMPDPLHRIQIPEFEWLIQKDLTKYASNICKHMHSVVQNIKAVA